MQTLLVFLFLSSLTNLVAQEQNASLLSFYCPENDLKHPGSLTFDPNKEILVIHSVAEKRLASDNKGVLIRMVPEDSLIFSEITAKFTGQYLIVQGGDA